MEDFAVMRIIPRELNHATIISYIKDPRDIREELQKLAHDIYITLNENPDHLFLAFNPDKTEIEIYSMTNKGVSIDTIIHGYDDANDLIRYLCNLANGRIEHLDMH